MKTTRIAIYARTKSNNTNSDIISTIQSYVKAKDNWEITGIYNDIDCSAFDLTRPQLQNLISDFEKGLFDVIIINTFSQLCRDIETYLKIQKKHKAFTDKIFVIEFNDFTENIFSHGIEQFFKLIADE